MNFNTTCIRISRSCNSFRDDARPNSCSPSEAPHQYAVGVVVCVFCVYVFGVVVFLCVCMSGCLCESLSVFVWCVWCCVVVSVCVVICVCRCVCRPVNMLHVGL